MNRIMKFASLLAAAVMLISCGGDNTQGGGSITNKAFKLTADKNLIQTFDGDYATLTVTLDGQPVTEGVTFFDDKNKVMNIADFKFSTTKVGEYKIWANYGTYNSETISIKAIDIAIPESPADPKPASTDFKARVLLTEFTTVGCSACPAMKVILHEVAADASVSDKVVMVECHSGLVNSIADPCYIHNQAYEDFSRITGFPTVVLDIDQTVADRTSMKSLISSFHAQNDEVAPGIAVNAKLENDKVVAKVTVKAKVASSYRVGAFLLEDGIYAR